MRSARKSKKTTKARPRRQALRGKQLEVQIPGTKPLVIDLVDDEAIDLHVQSNATRFSKDRSLIHFRATGHRWRQGDYFMLNWGGRALKVGDTVAVNLSASGKKATAPKEVEKYIEPEKQCSFCDRKRSEVKELLEANLFTRICNDCVVSCYQKLYGRNAT
jgi:hypothetical protein